MRLSVQFTERGIPTDAETSGDRPNVRTIHRPLQNRFFDLWLTSLVNVTATYPFEAISVLQKDGTYAVVAGRHRYVALALETVWI